MTVKIFYMSSEPKIDKYGTKYWCQNGKWHRLDGPAIEYPSGTKEWYIDGEYLTEQEWKE